MKMGKHGIKERAFILDEHIQVQPYVNMGFGNGALALDLYMVADPEEKQIGPAVVLSPVPGDEKKIHVDRVTLEKIAARLSKISGSEIWEIKGKHPRFLIRNKENLDRILRSGLRIKNPHPIELIMDVLHDFPELRARRPKKVTAIAFTAG
jgi:hypothetical protein